MFFLLSKTLYYLILPFTWLVASATFAVFHKRKRRAWSVATWTILLVFSNNILINELILRWEYPITPIQEVKKYDVAIVLGGAGNVNKADTGRIFLNASADRVFHTIQLFKMGKIRKILYTGGAGNLFGDHFSESHYMYRLFLSCGIPDSCLLFEKKARNTYENALYSKQLLKSNGLMNSRILLVTSAFHFKRAMACLEKQGIKCTPFATDIVTLAKPYSFDQFLPTTEAFNRWYLYEHELIGYLSYWVMGYL